MRNLTDFSPASDSTTIFTPWSTPPGESWWISKLWTDVDTDILISDKEKVLFEGKITSAGVTVDFPLHQYSKYQVNSPNNCTAILHFSGMRRKAQVK